MAALVLGGLWWWAVLRLALVPDAGAVEGAVAAGGWGLSLLPVHCVPRAGAGRPGGGVWGRGGGPVAGRGEAASHQGMATPPFGRRIWPVVNAEASRRQVQDGVGDVLRLAHPAQR